MTHTRTLYRLFHRQDGKCHYCKGATWMPPRDPNRRYATPTPGETSEKAMARLEIRQWGKISATKILRYSKASIEHLRRRADGGNYSHGIVMACQFCNSTREAATVAEHEKAMMWLVARGEHPVNRNRDVR